MKVPYQQDLFDICCKEINREKPHHFFLYMVTKVSRFEIFDLNLVNIHELSCDITDEHLKILHFH